MKRYKNIKVDYGENTEYMESFDRRPENDEFVRFDSNRPEARYDSFAVADEYVSDEFLAPSEETPEESEIVEMDD